MEVIQVLINFLLTNILTLHWVSNFKSDILTCYEKGDSQTWNMQLLSTHWAAHPNWNMPGVSDFPKGYITKHQHDTKRQAFPCGTKPKPKQLVFFARHKPARFFPFWFFWIFEYLWSYDNTWIGWKVERHFESKVIAMQQRGSVGFLALVCSEGVWGYAYAMIRSSSSYGMYSNVSISYRQIWWSQSERTEEFQKERDSVSTRLSSRS